MVEDLNADLEYCKTQLSEQQSANRKQVDEMSKLKTKNQRMMKIILVGYCMGLIKTNKK